MDGAVRFADLAFWRGVGFRDFADVELISRQEIAQEERVWSSRESIFL